MTSAKRVKTRQRIAARALELFERHGYEQTTVAQVAAAAAVTSMTVFRHFPAKEDLVLDDPYDPMIVQAIGDQPSRPALHRAVMGLRQAWADVPEPDTEVVRRRVRIVAANPALRAAAWRVNAETERLIAEQLTTDGADPLAARVASSATLAALMTALYAWAEYDRGDPGGGETPVGASLREAVDTALAVLMPEACGA